MKIMVKIFAIYMLGLALVPCGDGGGGIVKIVDQIFGIIHGHTTDFDAHSNSCGNDNCSPFCICSCCSTALEGPINHAFKLKMINIIFIGTHRFISTVVPTSFSSSIWQPPKFY